MNSFYFDLLFLSIAPSLPVTTVSPSSTAIVMRALPITTMAHTQHVPTPSTSGAQAGTSAQGPNIGMAKATKRTLEENDR